MANRLKYLQRFSPGWLTDTVVSYCPSRSLQLKQITITKHHEQLDEKRCTYSESPGFMEYCYVYGFPWKHRCLPWLRLKDAVGDQVVVGRGRDGGDQVDEAWDKDNISARIAEKLSVQTDTPTD